MHPDFLNKYSSASEINFTDHHPSYTLIKYPGSSKVYRLEPDPGNLGKQIKRYIPNEQVFQSLNFRFDRIVILDATEAYPNGPPLSTH